MPIARTFDGHGVRATCPLQLGIDPTTSASRSQDFYVVNSIATAASDLVLPRRVTRPTVRKQPIIWNIKRLKPFKSMIFRFNPLKPELNPICYLLALLGAHHFLHVSRIRVKLLTLR